MGEDEANAKLHELVEPRVPTQALDAVTKLNAVDRDEELGEWMNRFSKTHNVNAEFDQRRISSVAREPSIAIVRKDKRKEVITKVEDVLSEEPEYWRKMIPASDDDDNDIDHHDCTSEYEAGSWDPYEGEINGWDLWWSRRERTSDLAPFSASEPPSGSNEVDGDTKMLFRGSHEVKEDLEWEEESDDASFVSEFTEENPTLGGMMWLSEGSKQTLLRLKKLKSSMKMT